MARPRLRPRPRPRLDVDVDVPRIRILLLEMAKRRRMFHLHLQILYRVIVLTVDPAWHRRHTLLGGLSVGRYVEDGRYGVLL